MGVSSLLLRGRVAANDETLPVKSQRVALLFYEFLRRHRELADAERKETIWLSLAIILGIASVMVPLADPDGGWVGVAGLGAFLAVLRQYVRYNTAVNHLYVNVQILHHHLLGKLEVGFCEHAGEPCACAEEFRRYVWQTYRISLYGGPLNRKY